MCFKKCVPRFHDGDLNTGESEYPHCVTDLFTDARVRERVFRSTITDRDVSLLFFFVSSPSQQWSAQIDAWASTSM